jgi:hypothetical protein
MLRCNQYLGTKGLANGSRGVVIGLATLREYMLQVS